MKKQKKKPRVLHVVDYKKSSFLCSLHTRHTIRICEILGKLLPYWECMLEISLYKFTEHSWGMSKYSHSVIEKTFLQRAWTVATLQMMQSYLLQTTLKIHFHVNELKLWSAIFTRRSSLDAIHHTRILAAKERTKPESWRRKEMKSEKCEKLWAERSKRKTVSIVPAIFHATLCVSFNSCRFRCEIANPLTWQHFYHQHGNSSEESRKKSQLEPLQSENKIQKTECRAEIKQQCANSSLKNSRTFQFKAQNSFTSVLSQKIFHRTIVVCCAVVNGKWKSLRARREKKKKTWKIKWRRYFMELKAKSLPTLSFFCCWEPAVCAILISLTTFWIRISHTLAGDTRL